ncbi:MAG: hypothetical protein HGA71_08060 [Azonexaceae bacterium]|jgi:hypothetical protein|nr:hypothetical protein [Azonexaceae bacterium]
MKMLKKTLAATLAAAMLSSTANATTVKADMVVSGNVIGLGSIATGPLALGDHTKIEFNNPAQIYAHTATVNVSDGHAYQFCPDTPGVAWTLGSGTATNISASGNEAWLLAYRDDGTTPLTPTACWDRVGTGTDETITVYHRVSIPAGVTGKGALSKTLSYSIVF